MKHSNRKINLLLVDDSSFTKDVLTCIVESDPHLHIMAHVTNGEEAIRFLENHTPDVIIMDQAISKGNAFEATQHIMKTHPIPLIMMCSTDDNENIAKGFQAFKAGALVIIEKPKSLADSHHLEMTRFVVQTIKALAEIKFKLGKNILEIQEESGAGFLQSWDHLPHLETRKIKAVGIGASIGGPQALCTILSNLPASFPAPIFIVQQISTGFIQGLVNWLGESTSLKVSLAKHGEKAVPGCVYIAPDHVHMEILDGNIINLSPQQEAEEKTPSISKLFRSIAKTHGNQSVGILLTGLGHDGAKGLLKMKEIGAVTITQDEESCVVFELPQEAIKLGAATLIESVQQIPLTLSQLTGV